jgi:hypothetical protein
MNTRHEIEKRTDPIRLASGESGWLQFPSGSGASSPRKRALRAIAITVIALTGVLLLTLTTSRTDYIEYRSSGVLLVHHADPYSPSGVFAIEKAEGYLASRPMIMLNPPWTLFLVAPLGFGGLREGLFLWILATAGSVFLSVEILHVPSKERAFAYVFAPAAAAVFMGQSSPLLLLGFSLFLRFHRSRPFFAGASLLLMAIKPHLFLIFWVVLLVDCIYRRRFLILAGCVSALAAGTAFSMYFDPRIWRHYLDMLRGYNLQQGFLPTASMLFRMLIDVRAFWLLFVPSVVAILWGLWYYSRRKHLWDWRIHGMLLMIVTLLVSPYGWLTDEAVLLPAILYALTLPEKRKYATWILLAINTAILVTALGTQAALSSRAYMWTPITWLLWFLYATKPARHSKPSPIHLPELAAAENAQA